MEIAIIFLIGGLAWRIRGTGLVRPFIARFGVWAIPVAMTIAFVTGRPELGIAALPFVGLGAIFGYWGKFDLAVKKLRTVSNYAKLSVMGMVRFLPLFMVSWFVGLQWKVLPAVLSGASFPLCYLAGLKLERFSLPRLRSFTEWGEFLFGGIILVALALGLSSCVMPDKNQPDWEYAGLKQRDGVDYK